jgi:hypothetical protein
MTIIQNSGLLSFKTIPQPIEEAKPRDRALFKEENVLPSVRMETFEEIQGRFFQKKVLESAKSFGLESVAVSEDLKTGKGCDKIIQKKKVIQESLLTKSLRNSANIKPQITEKKTESLVTPIVFKKNSTPIECPQRPIKERISDENFSDRIPSDLLITFGKSIWKATGNYDSYLKGKMIGDLVATIHDHFKSLEELVEFPIENINRTELKSAIDEIEEDVEAFYEQFGKIADKRIKQSSSFFSNFLTEFKGLISNSTGLPNNMISESVFDLSLTIYNTEDVRLEIDELIKMIDDFNIYIKNQELINEIEPILKNLVVSWTNKWDKLIFETVTQDRDIRLLNMSKFRTKMLDLYKKCLNFPEYFDLLNPSCFLNKKREQLENIKTVLKKSARDMDEAVQKGLIVVPDIHKRSREIFNRYKWAP